MRLFKDIYQRAINPYQYDLPDMRWEEEGTKSSPTRILHYNYHLFKYLKNIKGKSCLDIGCGTGQLMDELKRRGARKTQGFEPSIKNIKIAKTLYPYLKIERSTLQKFRTKDQFDIITCIMVLVHIPDLRQTFEKFKSLLNENGKLYLIVENFEYFEKPRHGYDFHIEPINKNEAVIAVNRRYGLTADVIRRIQVYKENAKNSGLKLKKNVAMKFTDKLVKAAPRYMSAKHAVINHLLIYEK